MGRNKEEFTGNKEQVKTKEGGKKKETQRKGKRDETEIERTGKRKGRRRRRRQKKRKRRRCRDKRGRSTSLEPLEPPTGEVQISIHLQGRSGPGQSEGRVGG